MILYMLGNVVAAIGRDEPVPASNGVIMMRDIGLVGLLLAKQGLVTIREHVFGNPFPFTKRLRRYLTEEQHATLEACVRLHRLRNRRVRGACQAFLPRAERLAAATGARWPAVYARASVAHFEQAVGIRLQV